MENLIKGLIVSGLGIFWVYSFLIIMILSMKVFSFAVNKVLKLKEKNNQLSSKPAVAAAAWSLHHHKETQE